MQPTPPPPAGGGWGLVVSGKWPFVPPCRRGPVGTTPRRENNFLNRLQGSNYTPYAFWGTTYGTEMSSRSQPCRRLDPQTKINATFWQKRPKMARFGVESLFGPRPLPISPRVGVESKKGAKCDIIWGQDAKNFSFAIEKSDIWIWRLFSLKEKFSKTSNPKVIYEIVTTPKRFE